MNGLVEESVRLVKEIQQAKNGKIEIVVAPPFTALHAVYAYLPKDDSGQKKNISLAAQDVFWEEKGAYTGEVSPEMLTNTGCCYVIIGHSERRQFFHESNEWVNKKIKASHTAVTSALNKARVSLCFSLMRIVCPQKTGLKIAYRKWRQLMIAVK